MGRPKALLPFDGRPLIAHLVERLHGAFEEVVVVAAPGQELPPLPATIVHDEVAYQGPVGGLFHGLRAIAREAAVVAACDAPFPSVRLMAALLSRLEGCDVVVPRWEGRVQPLHGVYRASLVPVLGAQLAAGELRFASLFEKVRTLVVDEAEIRALDPGGESFFNVNTPDDYAEALRRWRTRRPSGQAIVNAER